VNPLPERRLPKGDTALSELSLGCAQLGNLYREVSDDDARATVDAAWQLGVRYFDTAPHYGLGLSERRLGAALASRPRDAYVLSSKVGRLLEPAEVVEGLDDDDDYVVPATHRRVWDFSRDGIRRSLAESLERLGLDSVDVVYLHDPDDHVQDVLDSGFPALAELRGEGAVGAIGAGMNDAAVLARLVRETDIDIVMLAGRYTLLEQGGLEAFLPECVKRNVSVILGGPYNSGILTGGVKPGATHDYVAASAHLIEKAQKIEAVCRRHGVELGAAAMQFPLFHPAVCSVIPGALSVAEAKQNVARLSAKIPVELWSELKREKLLDPNAPTPN
jgi:D-threo-aldose 1-dehydrogenase